MAHGAGHNSIIKRKCDRVRTTKRDPTTVTQSHDSRSAVCLHGAMSLFIFVIESTTTPEVSSSYSIVSNAEVGADATGGSASSTVAERYGNWSNNSNKYLIWGSIK